MSTAHSDPVIDSSFTNLFLEKETYEVLALLLRNVSSNLSLLHLFPDYEATNNTLVQLSLPDEHSISTSSEIWMFLGKSLRFLILTICFYVINKFVTKAPIVSAILETLILWTIVTLVSPLMLGIVLPCLLARVAMFFYLKIRYGSTVVLATPVDSTWGFESYANTSTCPGLYIIEGKCDFKKIQNRFDYLLRLKEESYEELTFIRMRRKLRVIFNFVCWEVDSDYHVSNHIKLIPGDKIFSESDILSLQSQLQDVPLSLSGHSPWDVHVVPKYKDDNHYALVFRIHHSVMDGVSTGNALWYLADKPFEFSVDPLLPLNRKISEAQKFLGILLCITKLPRVLFRNFYIGATEYNIYHGKELTGPKKFVWSKTISVDAVKRIKENSKTSTFSVLISCLSGAMRNLYLKNGLNVPQMIHAAPPVAMLPYPDRRPRNKFSLLSYPLGVRLETPKERLQDALEAVKSVSNGTEVLTSYYLINMLGMLPLCLVKPFGAFAHTTTILSNIPGPKETVKLFEGDTLEDVGAFVPLKNLFGIGAALFSYAGKMRVTFVADKVAIPDATDVDFLIAEFENQLEELGRLYGDQKGDSVFL